MKKEEVKEKKETGKMTNCYQEAGILILIGSLVIIALSVAVLFLELFNTKGSEYVTNVTVVIPFVAICIAFIAWKSYFFPKPVKTSQKKGKR